MRLTEAQYRDILLRQNRNPARIPAAQAVDAEMPLHEDIMRYCDRQWPKWKYIRARSDRRSTIAVGANDFTIFLPHGRVLCIECKSKTGKLSNEQRAWAFEMEKLGHRVHVVQSMDEFLEACRLK